MQIISPEMGLINVLANLTNLAIFMQITSGVTRVELPIFTNFAQIRQKELTIFMKIMLPEIGLTSWRI